MLFTVFTPTYNRSHLLPRLYESLCLQTCKDFEWLIVDDGSTDDTEKIVSRFQSEGKIAIRYFFQENGGKHRAINKGVQLATGELFFIADSDDSLPIDALQILSEEYNYIKNDSTVAGIVGFDVLPNGRRIAIVADFDELVCSPVDFWCKVKVKGDMKEVIKTEVLRQIPFPEVVGEKFCPEELEWLLLSKKYKMRYINKVIYIAEYQKEGLSANIIKLRMQSPRLAMMNYKEYLAVENVPFRRQLRNAINYWRFRFCYHGDGEIAKVSVKWLWVMPIGYFMHILDLKHIK